MKLFGGGLAGFRGRQGVEKLVGAADLRAALEALPERVYRKVARQALSKAATPILRRARANLKAIQSSEARGVLAKSLTKRTKTYKLDGKIVTVIGGKWPVGAHAHLVEFGHRQVTGNGKLVGFVRAKPFMRPAFDATKGEAAAIFELAIGVGVEREAKKLAS